MSTNASSVLRMVTRARHGRGFGTHPELPRVLPDFAAAAGRARGLASVSIFTSRPPTPWRRSELENIARGSATAWNRCDAVEVYARCANESAGDYPVGVRFLAKMRRRAGSHLEYAVSSASSRGLRLRLSSFSKSEFDDRPRRSECVYPTRRSGSECMPTVLRTTASLRAQCPARGGIDSCAERSLLSGCQSGGIPLSTKLKRFFATVAILAAALQSLATLIGS